MTESMESWLAAWLRSRTDILLGIELFSTNLQEVVILPMYMHIVPLKYYVPLNLKITVARSKVLFVGSWHLLLLKSAWTYRVRTYGRTYLLPNRITADFFHFLQMLSRRIR